MHNDVYTSANLPLPFPDALQEFKVEMGALQAQYGMHSAAAVNAVTKSGGNEWHGDAFEFLRNYALGCAATVFDHAGFAEAQSIRRNAGRAGAPERSVLLCGLPADRHAPESQLDHRLCSNRRRRRRVISA